MARTNKNETKATATTTTMLVTMKDLEGLDGFSEASKKLYVGVVNAIEDIEVKKEGLASRLAGLLYMMDKKQLYKVGGFKNTAEYAKVMHGLTSKGTVSDAITTFDRFGDKSTITDPEDPNFGQISEKYRNFAFSSLTAMKKLSDKAIEDMGITEGMTRKDIRKLIDGALSLVDKQEKEQKEHAEALKAYNNAIQDVVNAGIKKEAAAVAEERGLDIKKTEEQLSTEDLKAFTAAFNAALADTQKSPEEKAEEAERVVNLKSSEGLMIGNNVPEDKYIEDLRNLIARIKAEGGVDIKVTIEYTTKVATDK